MTEAYIQLPADGTGKRTRTRSRTIDGATVHEPYSLALLSERVLTTRYFFGSGALVVAAAADSANVGRVYLFNDADSAVLIALTRVTFYSQLGSALATPTSPRFSLKRFTATGTAPSGTEITGAKQDTTLPDKNAGWSVRTTTTNMGTITEGAELMSFMPIAGATAVAYTPASMGLWVPEPNEAVILRAGEGVMVKQADAGTTSDTRRVIVNFQVDEFTSP